MKKIKQTLLSEQVFFRHLENGAIRFTKYKELRKINWLAVSREDLFIYPFSTYHQKSAEIILNLFKNGAIICTNKKLILKGFWK